MTQKHFMGSTSKSKDSTKEIFKSKLWVRAYKFKKEWEQLFKTNNFLSYILTQDGSKNFHKGPWKVFYRWVMCHFWWIGWCDNGWSGKLVN